MTVNALKPQTTSFRDPQWGAAEKAIAYKAVQSPKESLPVLPVVAASKHPPPPQSSQGLSPRDQSVLSLFPPWPQARSSPSGPHSVLTAQSPSRPGDSPGASSGCVWCSDCISPSLEWRPAASHSLTPAWQWWWPQWRWWQRWQQQWGKRGQTSSALRPCLLERSEP